MPDIVYYKNKMDAWGPDDHGTIKNLELYKGYKKAYEALLKPVKLIKVVKSKIVFKDMTKDELNDYAAKQFPDLEIKAYWKKNKIISELEK